MSLNILCKLTTAYNKLVNLITNTCTPRVIGSTRRSTRVKGIVRSKTGNSRDAYILKLEIKTIYSYLFI